MMNYINSFYSSLKSKTQKHIAIRKIIIPGLIVIWILSNSQAYSENRVKTIVFFFSMNETLPAYQSILEGFRTSLPQRYDKSYNLIIEYLDVGRTSGNEYAQHIVNLYNEKFLNTKLDLIITVGPGTLSLLKEYGLRQLEITPTVEIEVVHLSSHLKPSTVSENLLRLNLKIDAEKTFKSAFSLFPEHKNIYIICGSSETDKYYLRQVQETVKLYEDKLNFTYITGLTFDSTLQIVKKLPKKCIVVIPSFITDVDNAPISTTYAIINIYNQCKAPLFTLSDNSIGRGGIGGNILNFKAVGKETAIIASDVLNGKQLKEVILDETNFYQNIYDWKELKRWNLLNSKAIPAGSIIINKEFDFISEYKWHIVTIILFIFFQSVLVIYFFRISKKQKAFLKQKSEYENLYRRITREDRLSRMAELTASLSHELNQPLTAILYSAQAGKRFLDSDKLDAKHANEIFDNIIEDDKRAGNIISGLRNMMKAESRQKEILTLNEIINDTLKIFHSEAVHQNIKINFLQPEKQVLITGDRIQLQQVVLNLLSNAARAMENTELHKKIIEISHQLDQSTVTVSVRDYGTGINEEIKDKLFKSFTTTHQNGLGIGLSISRSIIERHDGKIVAKNIDDGGAEFSFTLNLARDEGK